jgi:hypothetical protein
MKVRFNLLILITIILFSPFNSYGQTCNPSPTPPPDNDSPDDNNSFTIPEVPRVIVSTTPEVLILKNGFFNENGFLMNSLKKKIAFIEPDQSPLEMDEPPPILIIPSGGLYGMEKSEQFKAVLKDYVENGGFLIVFSQQHGYEFEVLPTPDGKPIKAYGWREDLSCHITSVYLSSEHPTLSGMLRTNPSIAVDGYFEEIPDNSIVLLRRVKNGYPVAFYYQLGSGYVFVSTKNLTNENKV